MSEKRILLTAFRGTSAELLVKSVEENERHTVLILPNDKVKDSKLLIEALRQEHFDYIISLGQRPNIKDKVHIETMARKGNPGIATAFDCEKLKHNLEQTGLPAKLSANAGTSFCNELYWNGLQYIAQNKLDAQMVFVHVPFEKNISDVRWFREQLFCGLEMALGDNMEKWEV